jgi:folate-binding protein YgfZ
MIAPTPIAWLQTGATVRLDHLGLIRIEGEDAANFLHLQLTTGVLDHEPQTARLTGYCSAKGRLLAVGLLWRDASGFMLLVPRELVAPLVKRLGMFVLRSKTRLSDASAAYRMCGIIGDAARARAAPHSSGTAAVHSVANDGHTTLVRVADSVGQPRWIALEPAAGPPASPAASAAEAPGTLGASVWRWLDIKAGLPVITLATQDKFVPQMVNLEALGGVDFKKGCYPGQEVVARSQYLGKLKRRTTGAHLADGAAAAAPGSDVVSAHAPGLPVVGSVVDAAVAPQGGMDLLVEVTLTALHEPLALGGNPNTLELWPVPYPLPDNEVFVRPKL